MSVPGHRTLVATAPDSSFDAAAPQQLSDEAIAALAQFRTAVQAWIDAKGSTARRAAWHDVEQAARSSKRHGVHALASTTSAWLCRGAGRLN